MATLEALGESTKLPRMGYQVRTFSGWLSWLGWICSASHQIVGSSPI